MKQQLLHTPEGVRDIYNAECEKKLSLEDRLLHTLMSYGYRPIQTPSFEFFDIFSRETGTIPSRDLYKFFDREGNTLVLRPDITPSIARAAAKYYMDEDMPVRFCYKGNIFINTDSLQGRLKENTQLGAELICDDTPDADAEMLAMIVECLKIAGLKEFQISVGHVGILQGMMEAAGLNEDEEDELRDLIFNNNFFGVLEFTDAKQIDGDLKKLFSATGRIYESAEDFRALKQAAQKYEKTYRAITYLEQLHELSLLYGIERYISFEPGMVSGYKYYTGIIYNGYTFGSGEPVVKGGRYDSLLKRFGKEAPSIGFAIVIDQLMAALDRQHIDTPSAHNSQLIVYDGAHREDAIITARRQRALGIAVELVRRAPGKTKADYEAYAARRQITRLQFME